MIEISTGPLADGGTRLTIYLGDAFLTGDAVVLWANEARASLAVARPGVDMGDRWVRVPCRNRGYTRTATQSSLGSCPHVLLKSAALPDWAAPAGFERRRAAEWEAIDGGVEMSVDWPTLREQAAREVARLDGVLWDAGPAPPAAAAEWRGRMRDAVAAVNRLAAEAADGVVMAIDPESGELVARVRVVQEIEL